VDPVPGPLLFFLVVPGIEPGPPDLQPRTLTTIPQRRSISTNYKIKLSIRLRSQFSFLAFRAILCFINEDKPAYN
jgi:hypothetical protein